MTGRELRARRKGQNMPITTLARLTGYGVQALRRFESGHPPREAVRRVLWALGINPDEQPPEENTP